MDCVERANGSNRRSDCTGCTPDLLVAGAAYVKGSRPGRATAFSLARNLPAYLFLGDAPHRHPDRPGRPVPAVPLRPQAFALRRLDYFLAASARSATAGLQDALILNSSPWRWEGVSGVQHRRAPQEVASRLPAAFGCCLALPYLLRY